MMRLLPESTAVDLRTTSMISQKLVEEAHRALETQKGLFTLPNCAKGFEGIMLSSSFWAWSLSHQRSILCL